MRTYLLGEMNSEKFMDINEFLDEVETSKEEAQIYINSWGGTVWVLYTLRQRLEELLNKR